MVLVDLTNNRHWNVGAAVVVVTFLALLVPPFKSLTISASWLTTNEAESGVSAESDVD